MTGLRQILADESEQRAAGLEGQIPRRQARELAVEREPATGDDDLVADGVHNIPVTIGSRIATPSPGR